MNDTLFQQLLYEEESTILDFKKEQYHFAKASDEDKSEILKDILGFANAWRRSVAYILIGVEDVRGGMAHVIGIQPTDHLADHSLQQFVNNLTNRSVRFNYEAFGFDGKQVGIIRIDPQPRPLFLKKNYGKLKKGEVYIRRGSSTDPTKPADPDEIASMGRGHSDHAQEAELNVEFAALDREETLGVEMDWAAESCEMPNADEIPFLDNTPAPVTLLGHRIQLPDLSSYSPYDRLNTNYYHEYANYLFFQKLFREIRLVIRNTGQSPADDVRLEVFIPKAQGFDVLDWPEVPDRPKERKSFIEPIAFAGTRFGAFHQPGSVDIEKNDHRTKVEIDCGNLQPGRPVWSDAFYLGIGSSGVVKLTGRIYAANLPQPQDFELTIKATIVDSNMTLDELISHADQDVNG